MPKYQADIGAVDKMIDWQQSRPITRKQKKTKKREEPIGELVGGLTETDLSLSGHFPLGPNARPID